jgi:hypothetical protein
MGNSLILSSEIIVEGGKKARGNVFQQAASWYFRDESATVESASTI